MPPPSITNAFQRCHQRRSAPWIPVVKVSQWQQFPSSVYHFLKGLCCWKKRPQMVDGEFTGTITVISEIELLVLFSSLIILTIAGPLNSSTQQIGLVCCSLVFVPWLRFGGHACWTWFSYPLAIGRWNVWAVKGAFLSCFCTMVKSSKCSLIAEQNRRK